MNNNVRHDKSFSSDVSILIVNWNSGALLAQCLQHLSQQTVQPFQVIVVDNLSSDGSAGIASDFENVTVLQMEDNLGFAAANNRGLVQCNTEFVVLLNPDAYPEPDWLMRLLTAAKEYPDVAAFGSRQLCHANPDYLDGIGDVYHMSGLTWRNQFGSKQHNNGLLSGEIFSPCAAAALFRRQALVDVGGFDEDYFCYVEDVDLGFRLRLAGHKAHYVANAIVYHVGSATTGGQHSDFSIYHGHRNLVWTFVKNMPGFLFWLLLPLHVMLNLVSLLWFTLKGNGTVIFRAKRDALSGLAKMWRKRTVIQKNRVASIGSVWRQIAKRINR